MKKTRNLGLLGGWIGDNSGELIRTQRQTFHSFRQQFTATNSEMNFTVPLRDPDAAEADRSFASPAILASPSTGSASSSPPTTASAANS
jgi:hypothetical protein